MGLRAKQTVGHPFPYMSLMPAICCPFGLVGRLADRIAAYAHGQYDKPMSFGETIFLFLLALLVFGPKKLPEIARQVGKILNEFRKASNEFRSQIEAEISHMDLEQHSRKILPAPEPQRGAVATLDVTPEPPSVPATSQP
jgi:TatA/E family protein of Tat protein translocase